MKFNKKNLFYVIGYGVILVSVVVCCFAFLKRDLPIVSPDMTPVESLDRTVDVFATLENPENTVSVIQPSDTVVSEIPGTSAFPTQTEGNLETETPLLTEEDTLTVTQTPAPEPTETVAPVTTSPLPTETDDSESSVRVTVYLTKEGQYVEMDMEDYVTGVLTGEMAYNKNIEALKAQAVVVRSYYYKRTEYKFAEHEFSPVCDDPSHCMTYTSYEDYIALKGEEKGSEAWGIYKEAALLCKGEYLTYNGEYVDAMCHSSSHRTTENSKNVYGTTHPYLVPVSTPEKAPVSVVEYGTSELIAKLFEKNDIKDVKEPLGQVCRTEDSDRVSCVTIFGVEFTSRQLRALLGLASTCFTVTYEDNCFIFTCYGQGHGLGLSQNGAYVFADMGVDYRSIVLHYFPGCEIKCQ